MDIIANADPPYHALIDTGAIVTGMNNLDVAHYLLDHGLATMKGVVYLDEFDRKMILLRPDTAPLQPLQYPLPSLLRPGTNPPLAPATLLQPVIGYNERPSSCLLSIQ